MQIPAFFNLFGRAKRDSARVAVTFSGKEARFAKMKRSGGRPQLAMYATHPLATFTPAELAKICSAMRIGGVQFTSLLAPHEYQLQVVDAPSVPAEELKAAVRWRVKDTLNYHIDDATIDVLQIPANKQGGGSPQTLYVVAASNEVIKKRITLFEGAKLGLDIIDIPEMAQRNIAALFEDEGRALALLAFDESGGLLTFTSAGELYLARRIEIPIGQLLDANDNLRQQSFDRLELEIQRSLDYFDRQFSYVSVNRMLVSAPSQSGLLESLADNMSVPVERLDLNQVMDLTAVPELADSDSQVYALYALGAALRQEGRAL